MKMEIGNPAGNIQTVQKAEDTFLIGKIQIIIFVSLIFLLFTFNSSNLIRLSSTVNMAIWNWSEYIQRESQNIRNQFE